MEPNLRKIFVFVLLLIALLVSCKKGTNPTGPITASTFYGFDSSLEGWNSDINSNSNETLSLNSDANYIKAGAGSIKCECTLSAIHNEIGVLSQSFGSNRDLSNRTVTIWVYVPTSIEYFIYLNVQRQSMPLDIKTFFGALLNTAGWNEVKFVIPAYSTDGNSITHDYSDVQMMYFEIRNSTQVPADWTGDIYFDELSW